MLNSPDPITVVRWMISPFHGPFTVAFIVFKIAIIDITRWPSISALTWFLVILVFSFIGICNDCISFLFPFSKSMLEPFDKITYVNRSILPFIRSLPVWGSLIVFSTILVTVGKSFSPSSMFHEAEPLAFIFVTIWPNMDSKSMSFWVFPFANVMITFGVFPKPLTLFHAVDPVSIIDFTIPPFVDSPSMGFPIHKISSIDIAWRVSLVTRAVSDIFHPVSFVQTSIYVLHDTLPISNFRIWLNLPHIKCIFVLQNLEIRKLP